MITIFNKTFVITFLSLVLAGCWSKNYDYGYGASINNASNDTLTMVIGLKHTTTRINPYRVLTLYPFDTLDNQDKNYIGGEKINEGMDVVRTFLKEYAIDTVLIYRHDTLKVLWSIPAFSGPCTEHSFFNYNSWKTWLIDEYTGYMMFTIYPSDLILNEH